MALSANMDQKDCCVYCIHGDGELQEGIRYRIALESREPPKKLMAKYRMDADAIVEAVKSF